MLEWTQAGDGARLMMLALHDDAKREYAYGPPQDFQTLMSARFPMNSCSKQKKAWVVISIMNDWKKVFVWEASVENATPL